MIFSQIFNNRIILSFFILSAIAPNCFLVDGLNILSDIEEVERLVVDFSIDKSWMKQLYDYYTTKTLCGFPTVMKLYLCQLYLKEDVNDFDYSWPSILQEQSLKCEHQKYSLRILDEKLLKLKPRLMYECPSTNEEEYLGQRSLTYIAKSRIDDSALVFTRRNRSSPLYPHRFFDGFTYEQLIDEMKDSPLKFGKSILQEPYLRLSFSNFPLTQELSQPSSPLRKVQNHSITEAHAFQTVKLRQSDTYKKFTNFYKLISICSLTNIQKLIFCQLVRNKTFVNDIDFEFDENQRLRCERQTIKYQTEPPTKGLEKKPVSMVRCPVVVISQDDEAYVKIRMIYSSHLIYMSNCFHPNCLVIYGKRIHDDETQPKIDAIHADFPIKAILDESRTIDRQLIYADDSKSRQTLSPTSLEQYQHKLTNYPQVYQLDQHLSRTEKQVLKLFEIINLTSPYEKFSKAVRKFNICRLSRKKKLDHCVLTYEHPLYGYEIDRKDQDTDMRCKRLKVLLNDFEGRQDVALIQCPIVDLEHFVGQYLSAGVEEKTAILYSQSTLYGTTYPTALAPHIPLKEFD